MKRVLLSFAIAAAMFAGVLHAQQGKSTTRAQKQHNYDMRSLSQHLKQTEGSLLKALQDSSVSLQMSAIQTIRELEQVLPEYPFSELLTPLGNRLKDENTDPVLRKLVALALEGLHSEAGDAVIQETAETTKDSGLATLCKALLIKGGLYK